MSLTLTHKRLLELLVYEPKAGVFRWSCSGKRSGLVAGYHDTRNGYWLIKIDGRKYKASRLAWFYMTGDWPRLVDHRNLIKCDDRWSNLRLATNGQNEANKAIRKDNKSGFKGVTMHSTSGLWRAVITVNKSKQLLGYFKDPAIAHQAYVAAATEAYGEFARFH